MFKKSSLIVIGVMVTLLAVTSTASQETVAKYEVLRLFMVPVANPCIKVTPEGSYSVRKGSIIEIDFEYIGSEGCGPGSQSINTTYNGVLKSYSPAWWLVTTDINHTFSTYAFLFRAHKRGHDTITLTIDGTEYVYEIEVE